MAEHDHGTFEPCLWHISAAGRPIMSSIFSPIPYHDWALPSQDLVDSSQPFREGAHYQNWSSFSGEISLWNEGFNRVECIPPVSMAPICSTFSPGEVPTERQGRVNIVMDSMDLSDQSNSANRSSTEQASSVINRVSPSRSNADHVAEMDGRSSKKKTSVENECTGTVSAGIPSPQVAVSAEKISVPDEAPAQPSFLNSHANVGCSLHAAANSGESESGWTAYLNSSTDNWTISQSVLVCDEINLKKGRGSLIADSRNRNSLYVQRNQDNACDDSSIVSDASSGPEQPLLASRPFEGQLCTTTEVNGRLRTRSKRSYNDIFDGSLMLRRAKLRRKWSSELQKPVTSELEDTASSPLQRPHEMEEAGLAFETSFDDTTNPQWLSEGHAEDVTGRLEALQALIPNGKELNEEEMLTVAIEYVRALELKVKMLKNADLGDGVDPSASGNAGIGASKVLSALQEKGLCLMPLSFLGKTL